MELSKSSKAKLETCCLELRVLIESAIKNSPIDFSVIEGHRGEKAQNEYFKKGTSTLKYPNSKHNTWLSQAIDIIPYPMGFKATIKEWDTLIQHIKNVAKEKNIKISCGHEWKNFKDSPHVEIVS